jgi:hypothetical protein
MKGVGEASGDGTQSADRLAFGHRQDRRLVGGAGVVVGQACPGIRDHRRARG